MLPASKPAGAPRTAPAGNSLIERTQRHLEQQIGKLEKKLEPLVSQLQTNGWYSPQQLKELGALAKRPPTAETHQAIAALLQREPGAASLGQNANLERLTAELRASPAKPSTVLLLATSGAALDKLGGSLAQSAAADLRELVFANRHLDNLSTWVDKGFTEYTSLEQMKKALDTAQASGLNQFKAAIAPVTIDAVRAAQTEYQNAASSPNPDAQREKILKGLGELFSKLPAHLYAELKGPKLEGRLETLLQRGPHGPDFEQGRNIVSLFMTNGKEGAGLHAHFSKAIDLEYFMKGGFIPDEVSSGAALWR